MATRKTPAKKITAKKSATRKTTANKASTRARTTTWRPQPTLSTTIGSALGALVVTTLLDLSWRVRIALVVGALLVGLGYLLWKNRRAQSVVASGDAAGGDGPAAAAPPTDQP